MLVLDNEKIRSVILGNGQILEAFPQFYSARAKVTSVNGCAACQKSAKQREALAAIEGVRQAIGNMSAADKSRLKSLLNADHVRIYWQTEINGKVSRQRVDF